MKQIIFLFLSFLIQTAIADEVAATDEIAKVNKTATADEDVQNDSLFSDAVRELDLSISASKNTQDNLSTINHDDMSEHSISTDIPTESGIIFEEGPFNDPPAYIYRGGSLHSTGRYCNYPYPHIRDFGDCPYYPRSSFQLKFKNVPSARERYLNNLINEAYLGKNKSPICTGGALSKGKYGSISELTRIVCMV